MKHASLRMEEDSGGGREVGEERPKEVEPPKCDRAEERQTVAGTRSVQLGQVMSRHARGFMPLSVELPRTFQVDPVCGCRTSGSRENNKICSYSDLSRKIKSVFFFFFN